MKCKFEHDGHCCNCGAKQYMIECKQPCETIVTIANADRIRAMSDNGLAEFLADIFAKESCRRLERESFATAIQIEEIRHFWYCYWAEWLKQPAEE